MKNKRECQKEVSTEFKTEGAATLKQREAKVLGSSVSPFALHF